MCAGVVVPTAAQTQTALPKEGPVELTLTFASTPQRVVLDKEFTQIIYDAYGKRAGTERGRVQ